MICRNCSFTLSGDEDYCPHCGVPLKLNPESESKDVKKHNTSDEELPDLRAGSKNTIFDSEPVYIYSAPEAAGEKDKPSKKKASGVAIAFISLFAITVFGVGAFVAAEYLGIVPALSFDAEKQTSAAANTEITIYTDIYSELDGIIAPDISYKPSLSFVSSKTGLSLRKGPADHFAQIDILPHGKQVQIIGGSIVHPERVYAYVPDSDLYGWLCSSYLTSNQAVSPDMDEEEKAATSPDPSEDAQ